ncbi:hypothetical protein [Deinococcus misasensis]|uniref:hypothetical protein n=1 Tax=Deinococcus misasensis TaxID=392413 RepID=UPI00054DCF21|nr:hypothetical protein [Deinococcus misasensis]
MNTPTLEELLKLADDLREACKSTKSTFPESEPPKGLPMGIALGLAGVNIPMPPQHREPKPHLSTALSEQDYAQLKGALDGGAASLGYPLGVSDELVQQLANRHGMASKFKTTPSTPANPPAPKPKFKKPRHPNARKRR